MAYLQNHWSTAARQAIQGGAALYANNAAAGWQRITAPNMLLRVGQIIVYCTE